MARPRKQDDKRSPKTSDTKPSRRPRVKSPKARFEQIIFRDWCKACGICTAFCPKHVLGRDDTGAPVVEHPEACIGCRFCELHCPDFAITIKEQDTKEP